MREVEQLIKLGMEIMSYVSIAGLAVYVWIYAMDYVGRPKEIDKDIVFQRDDNLSEEENDAILMDYLKRINLSKPEYPDPMLAPWVEYPSYNRFTIGWRMGDGEDYMVAFQSWFRDLSVDGRRAYITENPEPESWQGDEQIPGFYAMVMGAQMTER